MTITSKVQSQFFANDTQQQQQLIRIAQDAKTRAHGPSKRSGTPWTDDEHDRFLHALEQYPSGPWKVIAWSVGTRTTRQTMTHAQKYREKIARHKRVGEQTEALARCSVGFAHESGSVDAMAANAVHASDDASTFAAAQNITADDCSVSELYQPSSNFGTADGAAANNADTADTFDAAIALLLESYEPLDIDSSIGNADDDDDTSFWSDLDAFLHTL